MELFTHPPQTIFSMREERIFDSLELSNLRAARRRFFRKIAGLEAGEWFLVSVAGAGAFYWLSMNYIALTLAAIAFLLAAAYLAEAVFPRVKGLVSDLRERQKEVISGEVKKLNIVSDDSGYRYYVKLRGNGKEKFFIPGEDWQKIRMGDRVEIHRAKHSKVVLKVVFIAGEIEEELPE